MPHCLQNGRFCHLRGAWCNWGAKHGYGDARFSHGPRNAKIGELPE